MVLMAFEDLLVQTEQKESLVLEGHLDHYLTLWMSPLWGKDYKILYWRQGHVLVDSIHIRFLFVIVLDITNIARQ